MPALEGQGGLAAMFGGDATSSSSVDEVATELHARELDALCDAASIGTDGLPSEHHLALELVLHTDDEDMVRARNAIREAGGATDEATMHKFYGALETQLNRLVIRHLPDPSPDDGPLTGPELVGPIRVDQHGIHVCMDSPWTDNQIVKALEGEERGNLYAAITHLGDQYDGDGLNAAPAMLELTPDSVQTLRHVVDVSIEKQHELAMARVPHDLHEEREHPNWVLKAVLKGGSACFIAWSAGRSEAQDIMRNINDPVAAAEMRHNMQPNEFMVNGVRYRMIIKFGKREDEDDASALNPFMRMAHRFSIAIPQGVITNAANPVADMVNAAPAADEAAHVIGPKSRGGARADVVATAPPREDYDDYIVERRTT